MLRGNLQISPRKTRTEDKGRVRTLVRRGTKADKSPPVAQKAGHLEEPMACELCGAVYVHKTWRAGRPFPPGLKWTTCPACRQVGRGVGYGRVRILGFPGGFPEEDLRRRIMNVVTRARFTQPERRLVSTEKRGSTMEIVTTSQKLAHRIARELAKAFGGDTTYKWSDRHGELLATLDMEEPEESRSRGRGGR